MSQPPLTPEEPPGPPNFLLANYELLGVLGEGTFGRVYLARPRAPPARLLAIKHIKPSRREHDGVCATALRELTFLKALTHPNIIRLDSMHIDTKELSLCLAFEYCQTDLYEVIKYHRDSRLPMAQYVFKSLAWHLLSGLHHLHSNWVMHRDLKPSNILMEGGVLKIADFGLARSYRDPLEPLCNNGVVVTIWYRAPELLLGARHYTPAVDLWAAGCILGELLLLRPLFQGDERKGPPEAFQGDQLHRIFSLVGHPSAQAERWEELGSLHHWQANTEGVREARREHAGLNLRQWMWEHSPQLRACARPELVLDLLLKLLTLDPGKRPTATQAMAHEFFAAEPRPGPNALVSGGRPVASYPERPRRPL